MVINLREVINRKLLGWPNFHMHNPLTDGYAWFSDLGYCPLKAALRRAQITPRFPMDDQQKADLELKLEAGRVVAEIFQSRLCKTHMGEEGVFVREWPIVDNDLKVSGSIDLVHLTETYEIDMVIELKTTKRTSPNWGMVVQTLGYQMLTQAPNAFIILVNPHGSYSIWELVPSENGFKVIGEDGQDWKESRNHPAFLNYDTIKQLIAAQVRYIESIKGIAALGYDFQRDDLAVIAPYALTDPEAWLCVDVKDEPHRYAKKYTTKDGVIYQAGEVRKGIAVANCEWFCHAASKVMDVDLVTDESGLDRKVFLPKEVIYESTEAQ